LRGAERVFVVPDGAVHLVNFATLPEQEDTYLVESGPEFHYVSAERDLARDARTSGHGSGILALGDPTFGEPRAEPARAAAGAEPCRGLSSVRFSPLPAARAEVQEIARLWAGDGSSPNGEVTLLTGAQARESRVKELAPGREVLHLATHGFLVEEDCTREEHEGTTNPFLLSGIGLAGANTGQAAPAAGEDGILTALEVASLDLSGVRWAVLSACETGIGPVQAGEGLQGLRRAFETAGAATLIMSLWPVQDEATRSWMVELYRSHAGGATTSAAARRASLMLLEERRQAGKTTHPFYWGGFVAAGDWR
jgi:CHAT domain-containing protein